MRITITIDDDALAVAQAYAQLRAIELGHAISELIGRTGADRLAIRKRGAAWVFDPPPGAPKVMARQVKDMLDGPS